MTKLRANPTTDKRAGAVSWPRGGRHPNAADLDIFVHLQFPSHEIQSGTDSPNNLVPTLWRSGYRLGRETETGATPQSLRIRTKDEVAFLVFDTDQPTDLYAIAVWGANSVRSVLEPGFVDFLRP